MVRLGTVVSCRHGVASVRMGIAWARLAEDTGLCASAIIEAQQITYPVNESVKPDTLN